MRLCGCVHACDYVCTSQRRKEGLPHLEAGPYSYLAGKPTGQAPPLTKPHPGTVPSASLLAPSPPGDLGSPCPGQVLRGARLPSELALAAMPSPLPSGARDLWGLERSAQPSRSPDLLGSLLQRHWLAAVISLSQLGCELPGDRGGLMLLAPLPSPLHPWGKPLGNRDSPAWLKTWAKLDAGPFSRRCPVCIPCGSKWSRSFGQRRVIHASSHHLQQGSCRTHSPSGFSRIRVSLPGWTLSGTPAPQAKPGSRAPLRHCALSQASDLNPQGGPAQIQQSPGKPTPSSGTCLWWAHFTVWGISKAPLCGLCASFLPSCGSVCFHRLDPPHSSTP